MPKLDLQSIEPTNRTGYPPPFDKEVAGRWYRRLASVGGLTDFGVSHVTLKPGAWSSQRHWHDGEDEFLVMLSGEAVLVEDDGRTVLRAGDCAAWPKGSTNGHHLRNESDEDCTFIVRRRRRVHRRRLFRHRYAVHGGQPLCPQGRHALLVLIRTLGSRRAERDTHCDADRHANGDIMKRHTDGDADSDADCEAGTRSRLFSVHAASYCSITQGSSWALSIHSATCGWERTAFMYTPAKLGSGTP